MNVLISQELFYAKVFACQKTGINSIFTFILHATNLYVSQHTVSQVLWLFMSTFNSLPTVLPGLFVQFGKKKMKHCFFKFVMYVLSKLDIECLPTNFFSLFLEIRMFLDCFLNLNKYGKAHRKV